MGMGPLAGYKVVEIASIGPGPMCAMLLSDMGAEVLRVDRIRPSGLGLAIPPRFDLLNRGRRSVAIDLKKKEGLKIALRLVEQADVLIEGFRPGVAERLGIGPEDCFARNPELIYGRVSGWGQEGPLAHAAGHDINYIALVGALHAIGRAGETPVPPLNLVADYGGGALYLAFGIVCGLLEASKSGQGQIVDAAMVDAVASLMTVFYGLQTMGIWTDRRGENILDGGAHFYDVYETADGKYISIGAIEPKFYAELLHLTGLDGEDLPHQMDRTKWPEMHKRLRAVFKNKTRNEWCSIMEGTDVCFAPVLSIEEAPNHRHNKTRGTFVEIDGQIQPAPAPRFGRTKPEIQGPPPEPGQHTDEALADWGFAEEEIKKLRKAGVVA
ncbi:MAG: CoA transferase [Proteobacteria bacterium]|nr:CoA transferase [Pseudomonadota bacterium]NIS60165.1 CoA transferase [Pseudomonadota bacterium]